MKKLLALLLALCMVFMVFGLAACGDEETTGGDDEINQTGEISVFYYTFGDTYISSVRAAMDSLLDESGLTYQNYDGNNSQTTQTEQIQTAIAKGSQLLVVNVVDTGSNDAALNIISMAQEAGIPVIFFNRSVEEEVVTSYENCAFIGTDYEEAGHMQGELVGKYVLENYDTIDLNGDGVISYVMFKGQEGNNEAIARTQYGQEDADAILTEGGKSALEFYDSANSQKYLVDQTGAWAASEATNYMQTILSQYSEANGNMVELVIANNDDMALGAISALQAAGYNNGEGTTTIPVFGVDATDAGKAAIDSGFMTGTVKQDAEGMANAIFTMSKNFLKGSDKFTDIDSSYLVGTWRVNIPYGLYTSETAAE